MENKDGSVCIKGVKFDVLCYADDILLASTTATGLQCIINLCQNGALGSTQQKPNAQLWVSNPLIRMPTWDIDGICLEICETIDYLGTVIGNKNNDVHTNKRIRSCRKSF